VKPIPEETGSTMTNKPQNNSSSLAAGEGLMSGEIVDPKNYRQGCHPNQPDDLELSLNFPLPGCHIIRTHCPQFSENDNKRPY
jgi:hypothetical protein